MVTIQEYIQAMENMDCAALGNLFAFDATYADICPEVAGMQKYHCHGKEAVEMFFRNLFTFRKFSITDPQILSDREALLVCVYGTYYLIAVATILDYDTEGKIRNMTVRPA